MKKLFTAFALVGALGAAACGGADDEPVILEDPVFEQQPPAPPIVTEPAPMTPADTMLNDTLAPLPPTTTTP